MRRLLLAVAALVVISAPLAGAQSGDWSGGWTDPAASATRNGKPLAYLETSMPLSGTVSHPNGVSQVSAIIVPDPDNPPPDGCDPTIESVTAEPSGTSTTFHVNATFPCNIIYELKATAKANPSGDVTSSTPADYQLPVLVAATIPPEPVSQVDAILEVDGNARKVTLQWPAGGEADLLGYVVTRTASGDTKNLGQVGVGDETTFVDDDPPVGKTSRYEVTAVRNGPDDGHKQVAATPTAVTVEVPPEATSDTDGDGEPPLTTVVTGQPGDSGPDPGVLSSVNAAGSSGAPSGPPTTLDTGYSETLTYPDAASAAAPAGDPAVVVTFDETEMVPLIENEQAMRFIAFGLAALMGFFVITYVTRRAARDAY